MLKELRKYKNLEFYEIDKKRLPTMTQKGIYSRL